MFKIIGRIAVIGLLVGGIWYFWGNSTENKNTNGEFVELEKTENPAKKSDNLTFEIKKGNKKTITENVKKSLTKTVSELTEPTSKVTKIKTNNPEVVISSDQLTSSIAKFVEGQESTTVTAYLYEYRIDLSAKKVPAGNVTFRAINNGRLSHNITLKDGNGQVMFGRVAPGETKYFQTNLSPSTLEVVSIGRADENHNMIKTLIIK